MIELTPDPAGPQVYVPGADVVDFDLSLAEVETTLSGAINEQVTVKDVVFDRRASATVRVDAVLATEWKTRETNGRYESLDESLSTVTQSGEVQTTGTGSVGIVYRTPWLSKRVEHNARTEGGQQSDTFVEYSAGTLGRWISDEAVALLANSTDIQEFTLRDDEAGVYVRNPNLWANRGRVAPGRRLTGRAVWNTQDGLRRGATLITAKHVVMARHFPVAVGQKLRFARGQTSTGDSLIHEAEIIAVADVGGDVRIGRLDDNVPGQRGAPFPLLPEDWRDYLTPQNVVVVAAKANGEVVLREWFEPATATAEQVWHRLASSAPRSTASRAIVSGDSGQPVWLAIPNQFVLLGIHWYSFGFINLAGLRGALQDQIDAWGDLVTVQQADLSEFTSFA